MLIVVCLFLTFRFPFPCFKVSLLTLATSNDFKWLASSLREFFFILRKSLCET